MTSEEIIAEAFVADMECSDTELATGEAIHHLVKLMNVRAMTHSGMARSIRLAAGLSLQEVADEVKVGVPTLWRWEKGQRRPHGKAAVRYGDVLDAIANNTRPPA